MFILIQLFERTNIVFFKDFENDVHQILLQGDAFQLIKELFLECQEELHDQAHEQMHTLKVRLSSA
jgi:hypothetical protein